MLLLGLVAIVAWIVLFVWVLGRVTRNRALGSVASGFAMVVLVVGAIASCFTVVHFSPWPPDYVGEYKRLYEVRTPHQELLVVETRVSVGKDATRYTHLLGFDLKTGESLGRVELPRSGPYKKHLRLEARRGTEAVFSSPEGYVAVDLATARIVGREKALTKGLGPYRDLGFDPDRWAVNVELQDGQHRALPMGPKPPDQGSILVIRPRGMACGTWSEHAWPTRTIAGLLRAVPVVSSASACRFPSGKDTVALLLGRSTAFGAGHYLLGALTSAGKRKWSLDLGKPSEPHAPDEVLIAEPAGKALRLLVGSWDTIAWLLVDPGSGKVLQKRALY